MRGRSAGDKQPDQETGQHGQSPPLHRRVERPPEESGVAQDDSSAPSPGWPGHPAAGRCTHPTPDSTERAARAHTKRATRDDTRSLNKPGQEDRDTARPKTLADKRELGSWQTRNDAEDEDTAHRSRTITGKQPRNSRGLRTALRRHSASSDSQALKRHHATEPQHLPTHAERADSVGEGYDGRTGRGARETRPRDRGRETSRTPAAGRAGQATLVATAPGREPEVRDGRHVRTPHPWKRGQATGAHGARESRGQAGIRTTRWEDGGGSHVPHASTGSLRRNVQATTATRRRERERSSTGTRRAAAPLQRGDSTGTATGRRERLRKDKRSSEDEKRLRSARAERQDTSTTERRARSHGG